jgi:lambda family phage tail tape measure protein
MEDAIVEFTKTGKFSFKDMINSFLQDLLRLEVNRMMRSMLGPLGGSEGIVKSLFSFFTPSATSGSAFNTYVNAGGFAMGAAFNRGIQGYARGGMFTNSIVNQPTLFKAAKGLGVMGEAGPEAIMPLKRDSAGNLGVRGGESSVEVVVNNYTSERAQAKETTDSRGNRRVEVVIGDIVADQMTTNNSSMQQAMLAGYGARPRMIRR